MPPAARAAQVYELYTDNIQTAGSVKRVYMHALVQTDAGPKWYYFGTNPASKPPTTADPVIEVAYVQFPVAFDDLGAEAIPTMFDLALEAARVQDGITGSVQEFYTDLYEEAGVSRNLQFRFLAGGVWYYYGSTTAAYPPPQGATVQTRAQIQFPGDFGKLGPEQNDWLYDIGLAAGLRREGLQ